MPQPLQKRFYQAHQWADGRYVGQVNFQPPAPGSNLRLRGNSETWTHFLIITMSRRWPQIDADSMRLQHSSQCRQVLDHLWIGSRDADSVFRSGNNFPERPMIQRQPEKSSFKLIKVQSHPCTGLVVKNQLISLYVNCDVGIEPMAEIQYFADRFILGCRYGIDDAVIFFRTWRRRALPVHRSNSATGYA
jgi:hypothetical protein